MWTKFEGKKTYIVAGLTIVWAVVGMYAGWIDMATGQQMIATALTGAGLRNAIK